MLKNLRNLRKKAEGFTIIEVLIVLAIAGLILLIVFLAVPALQRSAKNEQRKTDVSAVATAVSNYVSNNNGTLPNSVITATTAGTTVATISCTAAGYADGCDDTNTNSETAKIGYYTTASTMNAVSNGAPTAPTVGARIANGVKFDVNYDCTSSDSDTVTASNGAFALIYALDSGSGTPTYNCLD